MANVKALTPLCLASWLHTPSHTPQSIHLPQAVSKDGKGTNRVLVLLRLLETNTGSLTPLLELKGNLSGGCRCPQGLRLCGSFARGYGYKGC